MRTIKAMIPFLAILMVAGSSSSADRDKKAAGKADVQRSGDQAELAPPRRSDPFTIESLRAGLNLDKTQTNKMKALVMEYGKERIKKDAALQLARLEFLELFDQDDPDFDKIDTKLKEIGAIQAEAGSFRIKKFMEAKKFLNEDQFDKFKKLLLGMIF